MSLLVALRGFHHALEFAAHGPGQVLDAAGHAQAHLVFMQLVLVLLEEGLEQRHQAGHFVFWAHPVFGAEGVDGEIFDAVVAAGAQDGAQGIRAGAVPEEARPSALLGPAAVAVHDDGDVARDAGDLGRGAHASFSARIRVLSRRGPSDRMPTGTPVIRSSRAT